MKLSNRNLIITFSLIYCLVNIPIVPLFAQNNSFNSEPDFKFSNENNYSSGLVIADMNNDGYKDIIVSNGQLEADQYIEIFYNNGSGNFSDLPNWQSEYSAAYCRITVGDIDKNGFNDIVVSKMVNRLINPMPPGNIEVYYNYEGIIEKTPSFISKAAYSYSCALGDADGDGDLDIASSVGNIYNDPPEYGIVYFNENGKYDTSNVWNTSILMSGFDVDFGDFDRNGFMDVIYANIHSSNFIFFSDNKGSLNPIPLWRSINSKLRPFSIDIGFINEDVYPDLILDNNTELGGDGRVNCFLFDGSNPINHFDADWLSKPFDSLSVVYLYDINNDNILDLFLGKWWYPFSIHFGSQDSLFNQPSFVSSVYTIMQDIKMADLDRSDIKIFTDTSIINSTEATIVYVRKQPVENYLSVSVNSVELMKKDYCYVPSKNWISLHNRVKKGDTVIIKYEYSGFCDLVIANWKDKNHIYYNIQTSDIKYEDQSLLVTFTPNPISEKGKISFKLNSEAFVYFRLLNYLGLPVSESQRYYFSEGLIDIAIDCTDLSSGIYYSYLVINEIPHLLKFVVLK